MKKNEGEKVGRKQKRIDASGKWKASGCLTTAIDIGSTNEHHPPPTHHHQFNQWTPA